ncbi:hypothetical protein [Shewanella sp. T24-MNA-CIBAN-0130]|uniref:hypothetical protein n=1 Tax=Shewanella sp. T24-MNA-CIBAN-0130 TaxID=3140470 RepID=UPI0033257F8E
MNAKTQEIETQVINLPIEIEKLSADVGAKVYLPVDGLAPYLNFIKSEALCEIPELTTKKGRDRVASLAAQVSRSKTAIEKPGREYLKALKAQPKFIEANLKTFVDACDAIRDETRQPLTNWEAEQKLKTEMLEAKVSFFTTTIEQVYCELNEMAATEFAEHREYVNEVFAEIKETAIDDSYEDYQDKAAAAKLRCLETLEQMLTQIDTAETAHKAELTRLAAEQQERETRIAQEAAAKATADAEAAAQVKIDEANAKVKKAEFDTQAAKDIAEHEANANLKQAELDAQTAKEVDQPLENDSPIGFTRQSANISEERRRQGLINRDIAARLVETLNIGELLAIEIVKAAARGQLGALTIKY